jgi:hypothetical protein
MADQRERVTVEVGGRDAGGKQTLNDLITQLRQVERQQKAVNDGTVRATSTAQRAQQSYAGMVVSLRQLATGYAAVRVAQFIRDTISASERLHDLSQITGLAVESLSVLGNVAERSGGSLESVATSLRFLSRSVTELGQGSPEAVAAFRALGLEASELKGLALDQVLVKVADAQARFADGSGKAAALLAIFGRSGSEMVPLLNELADGGFDRATAEAEKFGQVVSSQAARAADQFSDELQKLRSRSRAAATEGIAPLLEELTRLLRFLNQNKFELRLENTLGTPGNAIQRLSDLIGELKRLGIIGGSEAPPAPTGPLSLPPVVVRPPVDFQDPAKLKAMLDARVAAVRAGAQRELSEFKALQQLAEQIEEQRFAKGLETVEQFFRARLAIAEEATARETAALERERSAVQGQLGQQLEPAEELRIRQQIADLSGRIREVQITGQRAVNALVAEEEALRRELSNQLIEFTRQEQEARGSALEGTIAQIALAAEEYRRVLAQASALDVEQQDELVDSFQRRLEARARFIDAEARAQQALNALALERARIEEQARTGQISQLDAEERILALEASRVPGLRAIADEMERFATLTGSPALLQAVQELRLLFDQMGESVDAASLAAKNLEESIAVAITNDLANFLGSTISQVKSLGDAFKSLAVSILSSIQQILGRLLALQLIKALGVSLPAGFASGGLVAGPGTGSSDSVPARLSAGEFVVRASSVRRFGPEFFAALNEGTMTPPFRPREIPRYAEGGLVHSGGSTGGASTFEGLLSIGLEPGLIVRAVREYLDSPEGVKFQIKTAHENQRAFREALGG